MTKDYETKDSGKRVDYDSGMRRDIAEGKPRFDLLTAKGIDLPQSMLYRWAMLMERGRAKYGERNWEKANSKEEFDRFKNSAIRHFFQWFFEVDDGEDHAAAIMFNVNAVETLMEKGIEK